MHNIYKIAGGITLLLLGVFVLIFDTEDNAKRENEQADLHPAKIELLFGHNTPVDSALHEAAMRYGDEVQKRTHDRIRIKVYPAQELGNDHQMVELAREGKIDILLTPMSKMSIPIPPMQYADLPFFFPKREDLYAMLDGEVGERLLAQLKSIDLVGVTFWENGFKHFSANTPITSPDDFKDKKIRIMKSRIIQEQFRPYSAEPVVIDFHATKAALKDGVVDGQENPLVAFYSMGFHEVQSHLILSEHAYLGYVFSISGKTFEKLSFEDRMLLMQVAKEITPWERQNTQRREAVLLEKIAASGVKVSSLTEEQKELFEQKTAYLQSAFEGVIGVDLLSMTQEKLLERYPQKDIFTIGIDADLSMGDPSCGLAIKRGAELALEEINQKGGILGKKVVLIAKDNKAVASKGVENIRGLLKRDDLLAIIGGKHSAVIDDETKIMQAAKKPFLIPWAAAAKLTQSDEGESYVFRISANDDIASEFIISHAKKEGKRVAIMAENSIWGKANVEKMEGYLKEHGGAFKKVFLFNRGQKEFAAEIYQMQQNDIDTLLLVANSLEAIEITKALHALAKDIKIYSHWGVVGSKFFDETKDILPEMEFHLFETFSFHMQNRDVAKALAKRYMQRYGISSIEQITAPHAVAQTYDTVHILAKAARAAGSIEGEKIREALKRLKHHEGAVKVYEVPFAAGHDALGVDDYKMVRVPYKQSGEL